MMQVCQKLRTSAVYNCIPVIMVSAKGKEENIVEGLRSGSNDYITKPFGREEILARIKAHLRFRDAVYAAAAEMAGERFIFGGRVSGVNGTQDYKRMSFHPPVPLSPLPLLDHGIAPTPSLHPAGPPAGPEKPRHADELASWMQVWESVK